MADRLALIARIGAAMASADEATQAVLRDALAIIVEDHGVMAAHERRKAKDRKRKHSVDSADSVDSVENMESVDGSPSPQVSPDSPAPHITPSFPPPSPTPSGGAARTIVPSPRISPPRADVEAVVSHYVHRFPRRKPGPKDRKVIATALESYSVEELCEAIDGNADDQWAKREGKHELTWTLRDNGHIDNYRDKAGKGLVPVDNGWFADVGA